MLTTTLNRVREHGPCDDGWKKLLAYLGKTKADDEPLPYVTIVKSNGINDALWCCRAEPQYEKQWREFSCWCALSVKHLWDMPEIVERYLKTQDESIRDAARAAAWDAAGAAARAAAGAAARAAAGAAAWDAAGAAARAAAGAAAWDAARAAAWDAARDAAWDAAWDAARDAQTKQFLKIVGGDDA